MLQDLSREERLRLMKFVCSFAWADLSITPEERGFIATLAERLELDADELRRVRGWAEVPPRPEEVDPTQIPPEHRALFVEAARRVIQEDGEVNEEEAMSLTLLERLAR